MELLCQIGNRISNSVWEAKVTPQERPDVRSSREARLKFITAKYVQRAYVSPLSPTLSAYASPDEVLLDAVKKNDLPGALYGLALHANPNVVDPVTSKHTILLALAAADPQNSSEQDLSPSSPAGPPPTTYPLAELLMQNSGEIPFPVSVEGLSSSAKNYVSHKTAKKISQQASPAQSKGSTNERSSSSQRDRQQREKERLQKRVSSGARLHRAVALDR